MRTQEITDYEYQMKDVSHICYLVYIFTKSSTIFSHVYFVLNSVSTI